MTSLKTEEILYIQWGTLTGPQWEAYSVAKIENAYPKNCVNGSKNLDKDSSGPIISTVYDPRLGEQKGGLLCAMCNKDNSECLGHLGHIKLPFPIYNLEYVNQVLKILQKVCSHCFRPLILPKHASMHCTTKQKYANHIKICPWEDCGKTVNYYSLAGKKKSEKDKGVVIYYSVEHASSAKKEEFSAAEAYKILANISYEDTKFLGLNCNLLPNSIYTNSDYFVTENTHHLHEIRPESFIYTHVPVIPPQARPFVYDDEGVKEDDLTIMYNDLIKLINLYNTFASKNSKSTVSTRRGHVKTKKSVEKDIMMKLWSLIDNKDDKAKTNLITKTHRAIKDRIIGKEGYIQQNVGGKRVNYSARTVIVGGGIDLKDDEIGVPLDICEQETKPFFVGDWNLEEAKALVKEGKVNIIHRKSIREINHNSNNSRTFDKKDELSLNSQKFRKVKYTIDDDYIALPTLNNKGINYDVLPGDILHRHLRDGDIVTLNRQPTLRVESMVAFRVKIIDGYSFMLTESATIGFNADFDGADCEERVHPRISY